MIPPFLSLLILSNKNLSGSILTLSLLTGAAATASNFGVGLKDAFRPILSWFISAKNLSVKT